MTQEQKSIIEKLRNAGKSYADICEATGIPAGTIKAFCSRHKIKDGTQRCAFCGVEINPAPKYRTRRFCSDVMNSSSEL